MKIGVEVQIDVTKIEKARLYQGQKGNYLTMTTFIDVEQQDQYGNNGFIAHKKNQDEQQNPPILGNVKVFWNDSQQQAPQQQGGFQQAPQQGYQQQAPQMPSQQLAQKRQQAQQQAPAVDFDDSIPF